MSTFRLALALERKHTTDTYGTHHYCKEHKQIVDYMHIDECALINKPGQKITEIVKPLEKVNSIWELEPGAM